MQLRTIGDYPELPLIIILSKDFLQTINNFRPNRVCSKEKVELAAHYLTHFHPTPENVCVQRERHASKVSQPERRIIVLNLATKCRIEQRGGTEDMTFTQKSPNDATKDDGTQ